ncbi:hypothetical protein CR513_30064, partial [Mucuna pruriens]
AKEKAKLYLAIANIDLALREGESLILIVESTTTQKMFRDREISQINISMYDGVNSVYEHMLKMVDYCNKLKSVKPEIDSYMILKILESLLSQFEILNTFYNIENHERNIDEIIAIPYNNKFTTSTYGTKDAKSNSIEKFNDGKKKIEN